MKFILAFFISFLSIMAPLTALSAHGKAHSDINKVIYRVSGEQWVTTDTVNVLVGINATLDKAGLSKARHEIMGNLQKIANGTWHITRFDRSQDSSGLERLSVQAEARLAQDGLSNLRDNAKKVTHPGTKYRISQIDFTPSFQEVEKQRQTLRQQLYQQVKAEIARLNGVFPQQHYSLKRLNFVPGAMPMPRAAESRRMKMSLMATAPAIQVSNKIRMTALAVLSSQNTEKKANG